MRIKARINIFLLVFTVLPLTLLSFVSYYVLEDVVTHQTLRRIEIIANNRRGYIEEIFRRYRDRFLSLSERQLISQAMDLDLSHPSQTTDQNLTAAVALAATSTPFANRVAVYDVHARLITSSELPTSPLTNFLEHFLDQRELISGISQSVPVAIDISPDTAGALTVQAYGPLISGDTVVGYVVVEFDPSELRRVQESPLGLGETEEVVLSKRTPEGDILLFLPSRAPDNRSLIKIDAATAIPYPLQEALSSKGGASIDSVDFRNERVLAVARSIPHSDLSLIIKVNRNEALEPLGMLAQGMGGVGLLLILASGLLAPLFAKSLTAPLSRLIYAARRFQRGELDDRITLNRNDELGELSQAFNEMAEQLAHSVVQLENHVAQLEESEARTRAILNSSVDAIIELDASGKITEWNPAAVALFGYAHDEVLGRTIDLIFPPEREAERDALLVQLHNGTTCPGVETIRMAKDGRHIDVSESFSVVRDSEGEISGAVIITRDTTERRQADRRFQLAVEAAPNAMIMVGPTGKIEMANAHSETLFGYSREELIGQPIEILVPERYRDQHPTFRNGFFAKPEARPMGNKRDLFAQRKDGTTFPVEIGLNPVQTEDGLVVLGSIVDITARKQAELFMKGALREKEVLLKEIHHRVKNNMQVISSLLKLQAEYLQDEQARILFRQSDQRVHSMALIHERLYRSEGLADIDLAEYIRELASSLLRSYGVNSTSVQLEMNLESVRLGIDHAIPCGLLLNEFISNALKHAFIPGQKGLIRISLSEDNGRVSLRIADTGVGLPETFDLQKPRSLGMEIIRTLTEQLDGTLQVIRGGGTEFWLQFTAHENQHVRRTHNGEGERPNL